MAEHTPGPWEYVPSTEHHGPYVVPVEGYGDICDCYTMSLPKEASTLNGGPSKPIPFQHERADANARLIAAAPELLSALRGLVRFCEEANTYEHENPHKFASYIEAVAAISKAAG